MVYRLEKDTPYNEKKVTLSKRLLSLGMSMLLCGSVITISGRIKNEFLISQASEHYATSISYYEEMIETTAEFFKQNGVETPEECFLLYTKLLWNGYFSNGRTYQYEINNKNNLIGYYGMKVATGNGDCKQDEDLFYKIMKKLGYDAYQVACIQTKEGEISLSPTTNIFGNHVITVVEYHGVQYYFDTTNSCTYQKDGINTASNSFKNLTITIKPIVSYIYGYNDELETIELVADQLSASSFQEMLVDHTLTDIMPSSKILILRKALEPSLQNICKTIMGE